VRLLLIFGFFIKLFSLSIILNLFLTNTHSTNDFKRLFTPIKVHVHHSLELFASSSSIIEYSSCLLLKDFESLAAALKRFEHFCLDFFICAVSLA